MTNNPPAAAPQDDCDLLKENGEERADKTDPKEINSTVSCSAPGTSCDPNSAPKENPATPTKSQKKLPSEKQQKKAGNDMADHGEILNRSLRISTNKKLCSVCGTCSLFEEFRNQTLSRKPVGVSASIIDFDHVRYRLTEHAFQYLLQAAARQLRPCPSKAMNCCERLASTWKLGVDCS